MLVLRVSFLSWGFENFVPGVGTKVNVGGGGGLTNHIYGVKKPSFDKGIDRRLPFFFAVFCGVTPTRPLRVCLEGLID